jgi:hypothetical protein
MALLFELKPDDPGWFFGGLGNSGRRFGTK